MIKSIVYLTFLLGAPTYLTVRYSTRLYPVIDEWIDVPFSPLEYFVWLWFFFFLISAILLLRFDALIDPLRRFEKELSRLERKVSWLQVNVYLLPEEEAHAAVQECTDFAFAMRDLARKHELELNEKHHKRIVNISKRVDEAAYAIRLRKFGRWARFFRFLFQVIEILAEILSIFFPPAGMAISKVAGGAKHLLGRSGDPQLPAGRPGRYLKGK